VWERLEGVGEASRGLARRVFELVVHVERRMLGALDTWRRLVTGALHDLHTGDAQEYLLFLVGLAVARRHLAPAAMTGTLPVDCSELRRRSRRSSRSPPAY